MADAAGLNDVMPENPQRGDRADEEPAIRERYQTLLSWFPDLDTAAFNSPHGQVPVLGSVFVKDGMRLNLFSTIPTLGTPCDITLQELRIESLFPANAETDALLRKLLT